MISTHNHQKIRELVESLQGQPAVIEDPTTNKGDIALRIDFPGTQDETNLSETKASQSTSWDHFFELFDKQDLDLMYDPDEKNPTYAFRFIKRENKDLEEDTQAKEFQQALQGAPESNYVSETTTSESGNETLTKEMGIDSLGEQSVSGSTPDPSSDNDTTQNASDLGLLEPDDPQV